MNIIPELKDLQNNFDKIVAKSKQIPLSEILDKIYVSPPYFAFKEIYQYKDFLISSIHPEQSIRFEATPMSSAEAGRHLAILGSCALGIEEEDKNYYLASRALKEGYYHKQTKLDDSKLYVVAKKISSSKIECQAYTALLDNDGQIIFSMDITYQKLSKKLFSRLFKSFVREKSEGKNNITHNPYKDIIELENIQILESGINAKLPIIKDSYCVGHFDEAPMLPVGTMSYIITNHIGEMLRRIDNNTQKDYCLISADLQLFEPTSNDQCANIAIEYLNKDENGDHIVTWEVKGEDGKTKNQMKLVWKRI